MPSIPFGHWAIPLLVLAPALSAAERDTRLIDAVRRARADEARQLLNQRIDVNLAELDGTTALHWATYRNDAEMVALLLAAGAAPAATNRYGMTPLAVACAAGNAGIVRLLLDAGADANTASPEGEAVLMTAARTGRSDVVELLLARGADVNAREGWRRQTALMWAASAGSADVVRLLVAHGADVTARSGTGAPPAAGDARSLATRSTGTGGRSGDGAGMTALLFAIRAGRIDTTQALLAAGGDVNDKMGDGTTALMVAILNAHFELAIALLDAGASPLPTAGGLTPLHLAMQTRNPEWDRFPDPRPTGTRTSLDAIEALLRHGADPNARTTRRVQGLTGATPLLLAAKAGDVEGLRLLVAHGADPKLTAADGTTALMAAAGVTFSEGKTRTTEAEAMAAVRILLEMGADINAANAAGETALHGAAGRGANDVVRFLVARGAHLDAVNKRGLTPLAATVTVAEGKTAHPDTAEILRQLGAR